MQEVSSKITHKGKDYKLVFNLNVMERIQEEYGTLGAWGNMTDRSEGEVDIKALIFGITEMLNEGIEIDNEDNGTDEPLLTHKKVGRMLTDIGIDTAAAQMNGLVVESTKDDTGKNA